MFYLIIQLFKQEYKEDIFLAFTSCGIKNATFVEGFNLDKVLQEEFSLFKGILPPRDHRERYSLLIHALVESKDNIKEFINILKESGIDLENEEVLRVVLIPVVMVKDAHLDWEAE